MLCKQRRLRSCRLPAEAACLPRLPPPLLQPPYNIFEELPIGAGTAGTSLGCNCGHITQLLVGYATVAAAPYVASVSFLCSDGVLVSDPAFNPATQTQQTYTVGGAGGGGGGAVPCAQAAANIISTLIHPMPTPLRLRSALRAAATR